MAEKPDAKPAGRELKPGLEIVGVGKPYKAGGKRAFVPESVIKEHKLADYLFVGGPDKPKPVAPKAAQKDSAAQKDGAAPKDTGK